MNFIRFKFDPIVVVITLKYVLWGSVFNSCIHFIVQINAFLVRQANKIDQS